MHHFLRRSTAPLLAALAFVALSCGTHAAHAAGDGAAGLALAKLWCSSCHVVSPGQDLGQSDAPTFPAIARETVNPTAEWIAFELLTPHPLMPQVSLTQMEAKELAAYFRSLK